MLMTGRHAPRFTMTDGALPAGLWLIGLGPGDLGLMTASAIEHARACEYRFLEGYTATLPDEQESRLESLVGPWQRAMRPDVEEPVKILDLASKSSVAILVVGDPMQATTHVDLEAHCAEQSIDFSIIPGLSATALAVSLSGLQSYRFGRQVTLPYATNLPARADRCKLPSQSPHPRPARPRPNWNGSRPAATDAASQSR